MASPLLNGALPRAVPITSRPFPWPEFDRWQAAFAAAEIFPDRWDGLHVVPPAHTPEADEYEARKLALYGEWVDMLGRRSTTLAHYWRQGIPIRVARQDAGRPCPACDAFDTVELRSDCALDTVPPFHPGCRCVLVAMPAAPGSRRSRARERSRSRA